MLASGVACQFVSFINRSSSTRLSGCVGPQAGIVTGRKGEAELREIIESEVLDTAPAVRWKDVAGLAAAKQACPTTLSPVQHHISQL